MSYTVILYTDNELPEQFFRYVFGVLNAATCHDSHLEPSPPQRIVVSSRPIADLPPGWLNIVENSVPRGLENCYRKILAGLAVAENRAVFLVEHDVLYPCGYFDYVLPEAKGWYYNVKTWCQNQHGFFYRGRPLTSQLCADRDMLRKLMLHRVDMCQRRERIAWDEPGGNPGEFAPMIPYSAHTPAVDIRHGHNLTGMREAADYLPSLPPWPPHAELWKEYGL